MDQIAAEAEAITRPAFVVLATTPPAPVPATMPTRREPAAGHVCRPDKAACWDPSCTADATPCRCGQPLAAGYTHPHTQEC